MARANEALERAEVRKIMGGNMIELLGVGA